MPVVDNNLMQSFETSECFYEWLKHNVETELWLKIYKKASDIKSINWNEALKIAHARAG